MNLEKSIDACSITYQQFHKLGSEVYRIPSLQRPYSWDKKQVEKLWDDIVESSPYYYIGSIVIVLAEGTVGQDQIIDGQQRLTTLSLFLIAIRNYIINNKKNYEIIDEIYEILYKSGRNTEKERLSFSNDNSNNIYLSILKDQKNDEDLTDNQKKFINNLNVINDKLIEYSPKCKVKEIKVLLDKIKKLQMIIIKCRDKSAAYKLFESINATAINLATTDLIKNSIFESLDLQGGKEELKTVESKWQHMYEDFDEDGGYLKTYIRHHWICTTGYTSHAHLFDAFLKEYKKRGVQNYCESLFYLSNIYLSLRNSNTEGLDKLPSRRNKKDEIKETLRFLSFLGVDQIYPVLLHIYNKEPKNFEKDLIRFVAFQFLYKYVPGSPSVPEKKYFADFCKGKIKRTEVFNGLLDLCKDQKISFKKNLLKKIKYTEGKSGDIQYILEKYLYYKQKGDCRFDKPTIEHIIPQDSSDKIFEKFDCDKKEAIKKIHLLGNLTILGESENSSSGEGFNKPFSDKKSLYKKHTFAGNKEILNYPFDINPDGAIQQRGEKIAADIYDIFIEALKSGKWKKQIFNIINN